MNFQELVVSEKTSLMDSSVSGVLAREGQAAILLTQIFKTGLWTVDGALNCPSLSSVFHQWYFSLIILKSRSKNYFLIRIYFLSLLLIPRRTRNFKV